VGEVLEHLGLDRRIDATLDHDGIEGGGHVPEPGISLGLPDHEGQVAGSQARVSPLLAVGAGAAPVLLEELPEVQLRRREVVGVQRPEEQIGGDPLVEAVHEVDEEGLAADRVVQVHIVGHDERRYRRDTGAMRALGLHHVSINVADVEEARRFYVDVLGARERSDRPDFGFGGAWLDVGSQQIHLIEAPVPDDRGQHLALLVDDLDGSLDELRADGIEVSDISPVGTGRQAFTHDPSGNLVELHQTAS